MAVLTLTQDRFRAQRVSIDRVILVVGRVIVSDRAGSAAFCMFAETEFDRSEGRW
jgi:hypothetical protein